MASIKTFIAVLIIITGYIITGRAQTVDTETHMIGNRNKPEREEWFRDLGFGLFINFSHDAQLGTVISHSLVGASKDYVDRYFNELPKSFNPYKFDADRLAGLAKLAGMKYVVFDVKHHNGFCFWDTKTTDFCIMNTPYGKDLLAELIGGFRRAGLAIGLYYSPEDFRFLYENDVIIRRQEVGMDEKTRRKYDRFIEQQTKELFSNYGKIDVLFIDSKMKDVCMETAYRIQPDLVITRGAVITPEQYIPGLAMDWLWESNVTMGTQWNYKPTNDDVKSGAKLIELLIEARAKGGNFLLNVGPHPEGNLPYEYEMELREVAAWYFINHEAIENVRPWIIPHEENIWFTASKDRKSVYSAIIDHDVWPRCERREFVLGSVEATVDTRISVLGQNDLVCEYNPDADPESRFEQKEDGLHISIMRAQRIYNNSKWHNPVVVKLENVKPALEPLSAETHKAVIKVNASKKLHSLSGMMTGANIEDLNWQCNGGVYSQLLAGENFEEPACRGVSWQWKELRIGAPRAELKIITEDVYNGKQSQLIEYKGGEGEIGIQNKGINQWGIDFKEGKSYEGVIRVKIPEATNFYISIRDGEGKNLAEKKIAAKGDSVVYQRYEFTLTPSENTNGNGSFAISLKDKKGRMIVGYALLQPGEWGRYKGLKLRKEFIEALKAQGVSIIRYNGSMVDGCPDEHLYRWKNMIGPRDERIPYEGRFNPYASFGFGILDFLDMCNAAGFTGVPGINDGETSDDIKAFVEYCNGSVDTEWGSVRAKNGHPEPYLLKYVQISNESKLEKEYIKEFKRLATAIWEADPSITVVISDWMYRGNRKAVDFVDEAAELVEFCHNSGFKYWWDIHLVERSAGMDQFP